MSFKGVAAKQRAEVVHFKMSVIGNAQSAPTEMASFFSFHSAARGHRRSEMIYLWADYNDVLWGRVMLFFHESNEHCRWEFFCEASAVIPNWQAHYWFHLPQSSFVGRDRMYPSGTGWSKVQCKWYESGTLRFGLIVRWVLSEYMLEFVQAQARKRMSYSLLPVHFLVKRCLPTPSPDIFPSW